MDKNASDQTNVRLKESYPDEKRNLIVFGLNQILMRLGWMFKAESVVIPAFIDVYTSSGTIRGLLPLILRIGQSLPQFLVAQRVAQMPKKQGFFILHRVRFRDTVVCVVWDIKPNTLVRECHRSCFSGTLYPALARGRLQSSGERNITRKTHQSRKTGQATRLFQYHRLYTCDRSRFLPPTALVFWKHAALCDALWCDSRFLWCRSGSQFLV